MHGKIPFFGRFWGAMKMLKSGMTTVIAKATNQSRGSTGAIKR